MTKCWLLLNATVSPSASPKYSRWWFGEVQCFVSFIDPEDIFEGVRVEPFYECRVLEGLRNHLARRTIPLEFHHNRIAFPVEPEQIDESVEASFYLAPDDQNPSFFRDSIGI